MIGRKEKKTLVFGLARSGLAAVSLLRADNARVVAADENPELSLPDEYSGLEFTAGEYSPALLEGIDEVVISPGVAADHPICSDGARKGIPVIGELELAFRFAKAPVIALTGTNGKSTTVSMIGEILKTDRKDVIVAGNVGIPFSSVATVLGPEGFYVLEVSSFQLEAITGFHPVSAGLLNLTPDHLDRYDSVEDYYRVKTRITRNCGTEDACFYNARDPRCVSAAVDFPGRRIPFSSGGAVDGGVFLEGMHLIRFTRGGEEEIFLEREELGVIGLHNIENALAAVAAVDGLGVAAESCRKALSEFRGLEHRMELAGESFGVRFYNDSKATNVEATVMSLKGLRDKVILIAGGYDKGSDFSKLLDISGTLEKIITIGKAAPLIEASLSGRIETERASSMEDAVEKASGEASPGMLVVLSPACASFDMFRDFEHRGKVFKECVRRVVNGQE